MGPIALALSLVVKLAVLFFIFCFILLGFFMVLEIVGSV